MPRSGGVIPDEEAGVSSSRGTARAIVLALGVLLSGAGCSLGKIGPSPGDGRVVVLVSGGGATSPFTTPTSACTNAKGFAAGSTDSALREALLAAGHRVYTAPAQVGPGPIASATGEWGFSGCPAALPESMTVNSMGPIDDAGASLAAFFEYLQTTYGVTRIDVVAHSMGGLYSRSAIRRLKDARSPLRFRSLTTIGTPWEGSFAADYATGALAFSACGGDAVCEASMTEFKTVWLPNSTGTGTQGTRAYLAGPDGWNEKQGRVLEGIPVTLIGGSYLATPKGGAAADPAVWPNDNLVALSSALATGVSDTVLPHRACLVFPDLHSIYYSAQRKVDWKQALTFDPRVIAAVRTAVEGADVALQRGYRSGCPAAH